MAKVFSHGHIIKSEWKPVVAILDTRSAGNVILEGCFERLGIVKDDEVEYTIKSATDTNKKLKRSFWF